MRLLDGAAGQLSAGKDQLAVTAPGAAIALIGRVARAAGDLTLSIARVRLRQASCAPGNRRKEVRARRQRWGMNIDKAAVELARHRRSRIALPALPPDLRPENPDRAYDVQDLVHRVLEPDIGPRTGYKIGCTTQVMQAYLGIPSPCSGGIFARTTSSRAASTLRPADFVRVGIECEIAVRLAARSRSAGSWHFRRRLADAIAAYMPAIEVVDDRYEDWRTIGTPTLIADDFFAAGACSARP